MGSFIHELENNEALLLLYLADELPAEDRAEVTALLANDASLRGELERISDCYVHAMDAMSKLDADRSTLPAEHHAIRQATRAMKQWQVDRLLRQPLILAAPGRKVPAWVYPLGSLAALLIGTIAWWGFGGQLRNTAENMKLNIASTDAQADEIALVNRLDDSLRSDVASNEAAVRLADAELQANTLADRSDNSAVTSSIFFTESNP